MRCRGFEVVKGYEDKGINLPVRKTAHSAGYDVEAAEDMVYYTQIMEHLKHQYLCLLEHKLQLKL